MSKVLWIFWKELLAFAVIELAIRACVGLGFLSLPAMNVGGFDRLQQGEDAPLEKRLYRADRDLLFGLRAGVDLEYPRTAVYPNKPRTWTVRTNAHGFRSPAFDAAKRPGVFRIACLGDSSTFGMNVDDADAFPQILQALLNERAPGRFEVLNLGVPGFSSRQGLELLRREVLAWQPDLVLFALGTNDRFWQRTVSDDQVIRFNQTLLGGALTHLRNAAEHLYIYRLLRRLATAAAHALFGIPALSGSAPRVSLDEMAANIITADTLLREHGAGLVLVNNDFFATDAVEAARRAAKRIGALLLDMQQLFGEQTRRRTQALETQYGLASPKAPHGMALFRVRSPTPVHEVTIGVQPYLHPTGQELPMRDDGRAGDERAGDGIWSALVPAAPGAKLTYVYWYRTDGARVQESEETLPVSARRLRFVTSDTAGDIDTLGEYYLHSDAAHPDEDGYRLIAEALVPVILEAANQQRQGARTP